MHKNICVWVTRGYSGPEITELTRNFGTDEGAGLKYFNELVCKYGATVNRTRRLAFASDLVIERGFDGFVQPV